MPGPLSGRAALCVNGPQGLRSHPSSANPLDLGDVSRSEHGDDENTDFVAARG